MLFGLSSLVFLDCVTQCQFRVVLAKVGGMHHPPKIHHRSKNNEMCVPVALSLHLILQILPHISNGSFLLPKKNFFPLRLLLLPLSMVRKLILKVSTIFSFILRLIVITKSEINLSNLKRLFILN